MTETIAGYVLEELLARGGSGMVFRGREVATGRPVAIKLLLQESAETPRKRFQREAQAMLAMNHPRLVRALAAGEERGKSYLVLELISGPSLAEVLEREGPLPFERAARLIAQLARGVEHAHQAGVLHRDLKPANVLLDEQGLPRLTDFGLVRELDPRLSQTRLSQTGIFVGTPGYWAPEQASGDHRASGPHTDVYGLGGLLFALLTGRPPRDGVSLIDIMSQMHEPPVRPSALRPGVPRELERLCLRCLEQEPRDRPTSAAAVADALEAYLDGPPPGGSSRAPALAAGLLVAGGALTAALLIARTSQRLPDAPQPSLAASPAPQPSLAASPAPAALSSLSPLAAWTHGHTVSGTGWEDVATSMRARLSAEPEDVRAQAMLGLALHYLQQLPEAEREIEAALTGAPDALVLTVRGETLLKRDHDAGLTYFNMALESDSKCVPALLNVVEPVSLQDAQRALLLVQAAARLDPNSPMVHYMWGMHLGSTEERLARLGQAIEFEPRFMRARLRRAQLYWLQEQRAEARADLDHCLGLAPTARMLRLSATWAAEQGDRDRAAQDLRSAVTLEPSDVPAWEMLGDLLKDQAPDESDQAYEQALRLNPDSVVALLGRATRRNWAGDSEGAWTDTKRVLSLQPDNPWALQLRASLRLRAADFVGWLADMRETLRVSSHPVVRKRTRDGLVQEAMLLSSLGEPARARTLWALLLELQPENIMVNSMAALDGIQSGQTGEDTSVLEGHYARYPENNMAVIAYAIHMGRSGQLSPALEALRKTQIEDGDLYGLSMRARAYRVAGELDLARADLARALDQAPDHANSLVELVFWELEHGSPAGGLDASRQALAAAPGHPTLFNLRGHFLSRLDRPAEALDTYDEGLALAQHDPWLLFSKLNCLRGLGRIDEAKAVFALLRGRELPDQVTSMLDRLEAEGW